MTSWQLRRLGDVGAIVTGSTPPSSKPEWFGDALPFITPTDMGESDRRVRPQRWLSEDGRAGLRNRVLPPDSVGFVCIGATIGKLCLTEVESVTNQQVNSIIPDDATDARFLYYLLRLEAARIAPMAGGAATPIMNKSAFSNVVVRVPDLATQRRVGDVLGAIDDLIENNRRRVEVLEEMARSIYREWFVHFRYPGHETVPLVDSPLGPIPEGWEVSSVAETSAVVTRGIAPKYSDGGPSVVLNQKCIRDERVSFARSRRQERPISDVKLVRNGDVLINSTGVGTLGRVAYYRGGRADVTVDSHVTIARPRYEGLNPWYGLSLVALQSEFERLGAGSTGQTELGRGVIGALPLHLPPTALLELFAARVRPLLLQGDQLVAQGGGLAEMRDLLLPKLVTGQIDVSTLDLDGLLEGAVA